MEWIVIVIPLIIKMKSNLTRNNATQEVIDLLQKYSPEELYEIVEWEEKLRLEISKSKILLDRGEITDQEYNKRNALILRKHKEIEHKYNVTESEMVEFREKFRLLASNS